MFEPPRRHFDRKFRVERSSPAQVLRQVYANANTKPPLAPGFKFMIGNDFFRGSRVPRMNAFVRGWRGDERYIAEGDNTFGNNAELHDMLRESIRRRHVLDLRRH